uniref:Uncharacterized protein n=1 Tax=Lepeophtheirus salmonis TaxID=72036 RepID=A0A0K2T199_LEPSM
MSSTHFPFIKLFWDSGIIDGSVWTILLLIIPVRILYEVLKSVIGL